MPYAGQDRGAAIGTLALEIGTLAEGVTLAGGTWLNTAGGAPDGYLRYSDDAFAVDFTLPAGLAVTEATPAVLFLEIEDLAQMALDADPASAVDWGSGYWLGYEDETGTIGDTGGADCSFKPFVAPAAGAAPPATGIDCGAATAAATPASPRHPRRRMAAAGVAAAPPGASSSCLGLLLFARRGPKGTRTFTNMKVRVPFD